jgi:hypothetical protein
MKWGVAAVALVVVANGIGILPARHERNGTLSMIEIRVCADNLVGGATPDAPLRLRLDLATDSTGTAVPGLDVNGLQALGFPHEVAGAIGGPFPTRPRGLALRPAWVRIRQQDAPQSRFVVVAVAPTLAALPRDSSSLVIRGLVGLTPITRGGADRILTPMVREVLPAELHLDHFQVTVLQGARHEPTPCAAGLKAELANGAAGGVWVEAVH